MSYLGRVGARAVGGIRPAFQPVQSIQSPLARIDQRLNLVGADPPPPDLGLEEAIDEGVGTPPEAGTEMSSARPPTPPPPMTPPEARPSLAPPMVEATAPPVGPARQPMTGVPDHAPMATTPPPRVDGREPASASSTGEPPRATESSREPVSRTVMTTTPARQPVPPPPPAAGIERNTTHEVRHTIERREAGEAQGPDRRPSPPDPGAPAIPESMRNAFDRLAAWMQTPPREAAPPAPPPSPVAPRPPAPATPRSPSPAPTTLERPSTAMTTTPRPSAAPSIHIGRIEVEVVTPPPKVVHAPAVPTRAPRTASTSSSSSSASASDFPSSLSFGARQR